MRGGLLLLLVLYLYSLLGLIGAQTPGASCPTGFFGGDCTCTSDMTQWSSGATCSLGNWTMGNSVDPIITVDGSRGNFDIGYDHIIFQQGTLNFGSNGTLQIGCSFGNVTINGTVDFVQLNGYISLINGAQMHFFGTLEMQFDVADPGTYATTFIYIDGAHGANLTNADPPTFSANFTGNLTNCRGLLPNISTSWSGPEVFAEWTINQTSTTCAFALGDRTWVMDTMIAAGAFMVALCIFALLTCLIPSVKRRLWYPPDFH